ncbi:MAG: tubulin-like doman-containing protein [Defluviitaleaceae bacterium]|nr:tubulin-like doman-containing protein [Defluviitaleaceae bacterium]
MALGKLAREHLESELLLSKGGGIYYDNARVEASETEATLFIGLGGTGADMLIRIKNEVKRRMVLPQVNGKIVSDTPNNIGFLAIDSDKTSTKKAWGTATFDQYGSEFCSIAVDDKQAIVTKWKTLSESNTEEAAWYDKIDAEAALPGAGGKRQIGRLLLFENIRSVKERMEKKIRDLIASGINNVTVVIVAGIAGGTGSGTFIDIAYIARKVLEELSIPGRNIFGYIILPDVNLLNGGNADVLKRNGFAALKELDYWMSPSKYEQDDQFVQNYGSGIAVRSTTSRPFNFCHLLSAQDMNGMPLTYNKVINSMAENVFAYIAGEVGTDADSSGNSTMSAMYDNINEYIDSLSSKAPIPACYRYLAVGSHKLEIPYEEISTLLAIELFKRLKPTFEARPTEDTFKADMTTLRLIPKDIVHNSMTRGLQPSPLDGNPNYQHGQIWGGENVGPKNNRAYADVYQWIAREFQVTVKTAVENWANDQIGVFQNFIKDSMKKPDKGPLYLAALMKSDNKWSIIPTLTSLAEQCDGIASTCMSQTAQIEANLQTAYNAGHGKLLNRSKYVTDYLTALFEWMVNENSIFVYPQRAKEIRDLRDRLQLYYDKVFSKLADVLDALPDIFRQNYDYMVIAEREAESEGLIEEGTRLIWPLKYVKKKATDLRDFDKMLDEAVIRFLDDMTASLSRWTGSDLDSLDDAPTGTDVPGFISQFVSQQFGGLLTINMEDLMRSKEGADDLDKYLHLILPSMKDKAVPMFSMRQQYRNTSTAEFGLTSVPQDCLEIKAAANKYVKSDKMFVKPSKEKTRLYFVKVVSGVPLYAYAKIEDMEKEYETAKKTQTTRDGTHLNGKWWGSDIMPSPLPEAAWTPTVYTNPNVKAHNDEIREAFDFCLKNNVIRPDNEASPSKYLLYIADAQKADPSNLDFSEHASLEEQLSALREERDTLWSGDSIELMGMGTSGTADLLKTVRESILRLPRICNEIKRQSEIVSAFSQMEKELEDPRYFAFGLVCGLVAKQGYKIVAKRSVSSASSELLYDTTLEKPFGEHEAYKAFRKLLDDTRRQDIHTMRTEMLERVSTDETEKAEVMSRVEAIAKTYKAELQEAKSRIERAPVDKRKPLKDIYAFYATVLKIAENYRDKYLV